MDIDRIGSIASPSNGVCDVLNGLEVRQATKRDVRLVVEVQTTVGDLADCPPEGQLFRRQIEFQDIVRRADWRRRKDCFVVVWTWTEYHVETIPGEGALELCKREERRRRCLLSCLESELDW